MKNKISALAPIVAVSFLAAFSAGKKIQADSGTSLVLKPFLLLQKKKKKNTSLSTSVFLNLFFT